MSPHLVMPLWCLVISWGGRRSTACSWASQGAKGGPRRPSKAAMHLVRKPKSPEKSESDPCQNVLHCLSLSLVFHCHVLRVSRVDRIMCRILCLWCLCLRETSDSSKVVQRWRNSFDWWSAQKRRPKISQRSEWFLKRTAKIRKDGFWFWILNGFEVSILLLVDH